MNLRRSTVLLTLAWAASAHAATVWSMPDPLPGAPADGIAAAFPTPDLSWVERVKRTNERARKEAQDIRLVFDGDSITDCWSSDRGRDIWKERYARYHAFNFGIWGDRTEQILWRLSQGQMDGLHPRLIVLLIGTNNLERNTDSEIVEGIATVVREYRKRCPEAVILLQGIFPRGAKPSDPNRPRIKAINAAIARLDDGRQVVFRDFGERFLGADGTFPPGVMPDNLHPHQKGYAIWADAIQPVIDQYLGR